MKEPKKNHDVTNHDEQPEPKAGTHEFHKDEAKSPPAKDDKKKLAYADFCVLFTPAEMTVLLTNSVGIGWLLQLAATGGASPSDPAVATGLDTLVRHNLLLPARQAQITAGTPPT